MIKEGSMVVAIFRLHWVSFRRGSLIIDVGKFQNLKRQINGLLLNSIIIYSYVNKSYLKIIGRSNGSVDHPASLDIF